MLSAIGPFSAMVFPACLMAAVVTDVRRYIIPNEISIILVLGFVAAALMTGMPATEIGAHALTGALALLFGFLLFVFRVCGAGDSKLLAASALWLGPDATPYALVLIALSGGVLSLALIGLRQSAMWFPRLISFNPLFARLLRRPLMQVPAPYGVAIAAGSLIAFAQTAWWRDIAALLA